MRYSAQEVLQYVREEDVKFIRLAFCDVFGVQKNISIMPNELSRALDSGISIDASAIHGFGDESCSDLLLCPDPGTLAGLPWRPEHGRVVRMYCNLIRPDGTPFPCDTRALLQASIQRAEEAGVRFFFGSEMEFYLFQLDSQGNPSREPHDHAGYMDMAPEDRGENVRREICLTLEQMGIRPESSHHEEGPGQNEIDFRYSDPLTAADNAMTFQTVVKTAAAHNGLWADFSPKPLPDLPGNGFHINLSVQGDTSEDLLPYTIAGILDKIRELTVFLNPCRQSYHRFGVQKAPAYISWSANNRSQLIRIPAATGEYRRAELRSPDTSANPYLAFSLLIEAGLSGIAQKLSLVPPTEVNLYTADKQILSGLCRLPTTLEAAVDLAEHSPFITRCLPAALIQSYCRHR